MKRSFLSFLFNVCLVVLPFVFISCGGEELGEVQDIILREVNVSLNDTIARKIYEFQDRLQSDSLIAFFRHRDPTYRYLASLAFGTLRDSSAINDLIPLLRDPVYKVREGAAYALGQIGHGSAERHLIEAFQDHDSVEVNSPLSSIILEAIGKCGAPSSLPLLSSATTYRDEDNHLLTGQARAIFRYMTRGIVDSSGTRRMVELLAKPDLPQGIHHLAAHYLARANVSLESQKDILELIYSNLPDGDIKAILPAALIKTGADGIAKVSQSLTSDDFRLKCASLRALGGQNFATHRQKIQKALYDPNIAVSSTAADIMLQHGSSRYWRTFMNLSLGNFPWQVKIPLLHAVSRYIPPGNAMFARMNSDFLMQRYRRTSNVYEKAAVVKALGEETHRASYIIAQKKANDDQVIKTACTEALVNIALSPKFTRLKNSIRKEVIDHLITTLQSGDVAMVEITSGILDLDLTPYGHDLSAVLDQAIGQLQMPRDIEAIIPLRQKQAELTGIVYDPQSDFRYTHPVDWSTLDQAPDDMEAEIQTNQGKIVIKLYPEHAPATVANFVDLVNVNYYAEKPIHRVVPGFVIQGGCNRGDGYGSLDYSIRSEVGPFYYEGPGYIGMASAGKNTESAQWFITQNSTPHLDGQYSLFGKVISGIDVVYETKMGDVIQHIKMVEPQAIQ